MDAGADAVLVAPVASATLAGSIEGVDTSQLSSVVWTQLSGPGATITDPAALTTTVSPTAPGVLRFRLTVTDTGGFTASDEIVVYAIDDAGDGELDGTLRKWHKVSIKYTHGAQLFESTGANPFRDLRLQTYFIHPASGTVYDVPGFFAADGNAADTGASSGTKWRTHFRPDRSGRWYYLASFRLGTDIAIDTNPFAGSRGSIDGANCSFDVETADPAASGFLSKGRLEYVGKHHFRFAEDAGVLPQGRHGQSWRTCWPTTNSTTPSTWAVRPPTCRTACTTTTPTSATTAARARRRGKAARASGSSEPSPTWPTAESTALTSSPTTPTVETARRSIPGRIRPTGRASTSASSTSGGACSTT